MRHRESKIGAGSNAPNSELCHVFAERDCNKPTIICWTKTVNGLRGVYN
jgi:hypothetical protein